MYLSIRQQVERQQAATAEREKRAPAAAIAPKAEQAPVDARTEISDFLKAQIKPQQSTAQIDINHNGAPSGVTMDA